MMLPVSGPFHCALMHPAAERMAARLREAQVRAPNIPVLHNAHLRAENDADAIRRALVAQIESPVRWVDTIRKMMDPGSELVPALSGIVELDEKYIGGKPRYQQGVVHKRGKGTAKQ